MKEKIIQLRNEGNSYTEIERILGCSKGTIAYHCGVGQKEKVKQRNKSYRSNLLTILKRKKDNFCCVGERKCKGNPARKRMPSPFSSKDFLKKMTDNPICYLTGRNIDLTSPKTYQCDHIIPVSRGGRNALDNMGLTCKEANMAKSNMSFDEFINLCKEVLVHNGYKISHG